MLDSGVTSLIKNYKLSTADISQVCDGNWDTLKSTVKPTDGGQPKSAADIASSLSYRPARHGRSRSRSNSRSRRHSIDSAFEEKQQDGPSSSFLPGASFTSNDGESFGFLDLSEKTDISEKTDSSERRSSAPDLTSQKRRPSRRVSDGDDSRSSLRTSGSRNVVMRKLSEPMHRCSTTNSSVSGIMRPSRYSSNNLAAMDCSAGSAGLGRTTSCLNFSSLQSQGTDNPSLPRTTSATWVAHGVEFSKIMEVYVFEKRTDEYY